MLQIGKIKLRDIKELQAESASLLNNVLSPPRKKKNSRSATTSKKCQEQKINKYSVIDSATDVTTTLTKASAKRVLKSSINKTPANQRLIDSYFTSCPKTYDIKPPKESPKTSDKCRAQTDVIKAKEKRNISRISKKMKSPRRTKARRKRLFTDSTQPSSESGFGLSSNPEFKKLKTIECITIYSDSEDESKLKANEIAECGAFDNVVDVENVSVPSSSVKTNPNLTANNSKASLINPSPTTSSALSFGKILTTTSCEKTESNLETLVSTSKPARKTKPCPPYKIIEDTTFAVDAFQFGCIENVTHYFLTHFHADHYIGLTKSFAMPLYVSPITARLIRTFIKVQDQYIHELELNQTYVINGIEVTALDANHCPGSILLVFKFAGANGKCILHTGDFRACHEMESEPIFWNNDVHTVYLDTTYISDKYAFCTQYESIVKVQDLIDKFLEKHGSKRVLYVCGSYIIGKEKFWSSIAEKYNLKVWAEGNRYKALQAINEERFNRFLVEDPYEANMHVIPMGKLSYVNLIEYSKLYEQQYDVVFAIRPSGWEKNTKPRYGNKINLVGIEYSEHSSFQEMQRFVKFLKPKQVISTVPLGRDLMKTPKVPHSWYKYDQLKSSSNYQPSIDSFLDKSLRKKITVRLPHLNTSQLENIVSPLKLANLAPNEMSINFEQDNVNSKHIESNAITEKLSSKIKMEVRTKSFRKRTARSKTIVSISNSSEDFEKSDLVITNKKLQQNKKNSEKQIRNNNLTLTKTQPFKKQLKENNSNSTIVINSERRFESPEISLKNKCSMLTRNKKVVYDENITSTERTAISKSHTHYTSEDEMQMPVHETLKANGNEIPTVSPKSIKVSSNSQNKYETQNLRGQNDKKLNSKSQLYCTVSQRNVIHKSSIDSTSTDILHASDKSIKQDLDIPRTQRRMTRLQNALMESSGNSLGSQNRSEKEFDANLSSLIDGKVNKSKLNCTTNSNTSRENPLFQITTEPTVNSTDIDEMREKSLNSKEVKLSAPTNSENWLREFERENKSVGSKRQALSRILSPLKKTKHSIDTQTILNAILEHADDVDRFNCSQLASLVIDTVNKQVPDNSKDHIPADLLSDADDDWM